MKIAIHHSKNSFSDRWIKYCQDNDIDYKLVNCYESDIINQLENYDVLMWHWSQEDPKANLFAKQLTFAVEAMGKVVFPDSKTAWHFDDKVAQKYLFEAVNAPLVPSYVFYSKEEALKWSNRTTFPKVFKLRGGAGSINVKLVRNKKTALKLINKAFSDGFGASGRKELFKNRIWLFKKDKSLKSLIGILKGFIRLFLKTDLERVVGNEKGYCYFQDFIPNNKSDIRIIVIGKKAFAIERMVRDGDFRASGSGIIKYLDNDTIDKGCLSIAFDTSRKIQSQCLAYDFVYDGDKPLIVEISYGFAIEAYDSCPGFWDSNLNWKKGTFVPQNFMIENLMKPDN